MKFFSRSNYPKCQPVESGDKFVPTYKKVIGADGALKLVKDGLKPHYQMIQACLEGTKIENIIKAYANGDINALNKRAGVYADISKMPNDLLSAYKTINDARGIFEKLPLDQRQKYNNSFANWLSAVDDGSYVKQYEKKKADNISNNENNEGENN